MRNWGVAPSSTYLSISLRELYQATGTLRLSMSPGAGRWQSSSILHDAGAVKCNSDAMHQVMLGIDMEFGKLHVCEQIDDSSTTCSASA